MSLPPSVLRRVKQLRSQSIYPMALATAVAIARYEAKDWSESEYPFLADFGAYGKDSVTAEIGPFTVTVRLVPDYDSSLGEDDVTGTFSDQEHQPENAIRNSQSGWNGRGARWYNLPKYVLTLADYYIKEDRKSRALIDALVREAAQTSMRDDNERNFYGVTVTVAIDDDEIAGSALHGIDSLGNPGESSYFCETAAELLGEALDEARAALVPAAETADAHAARIRAAIQEA